MGAEPLLEIDGLVVVVDAVDGPRTVVHGVDLTVHAGEPMGLVGESGSGKSMILRAIMGLLPPRARVAEGQIRLHGRELLRGGPKGGYCTDVRGRGISMVFQEPSSALNPVMRIGRQVTDSLVALHGMSRKEARGEAVRLLGEVGIPDADRRVDNYPFELSGGMQQRVMIAAAVAPGPELLLCDEPTTALDVTIQAQVIDLLGRLQRDAGLGMLYVTHDIAVVAQLCTSLTVLRSGRVVEHGRLRALFDDPQHEYTKTLLSATPRIDRPGSARVMSA
jgi:ABC-type dipeptide/oligopeptide/nickel transport system ATPase component